MAAAANVSPYLMKYNTGGGKGTFDFNILPERDDLEMLATLKQTLSSPKR